MTKQTQVVLEPASQPEQLDYVMGNILMWIIEYQIKPMLFGNQPVNLNRLPYEI